MLISPRRLTCPTLRDMLPPEIKRMRTALRQAEKRKRTTAPADTVQDLQSFLVRRADNGRAVANRIPINDDPIDLAEYAEHQQTMSGHDYGSGGSTSSSLTESLTDFSSTSEGECNNHINEPFEEIGIDDLPHATQTDLHQDQFLHKYRESARERWHRKKSGQKTYWTENRRSLRFKY